MRAALVLAALLHTSGSERAPADQPAGVAAQSTTAVRLEVVARLGDDDERVQQLIAARLVAVVAELGAESLPDADRTLYVVVESVGAKFVVKLATSRGDEPLTRATEFECEECTGAQLLDTLAAEAKPVLQVLLADEEPSPPPPATTGAPPPPPSLVDAEPSRPRLGAKGSAGIGLLSSGAAIAATGIAFVVIDDRRVEARPTMLRDFTPAGIALLVSGCAAAITGAALLGLDRSPPRRGSAR